MSGKKRVTREVVEEEAEEEEEVEDFGYPSPQCPRKAARAE